jgi:hypothetical protein
LKRKYPLPNGQAVDGEEVEFEVENEGFSIYRLQDGTRLKMKNVVMQIIRLDAVQPDGSPIYMVQAASILST